MMEHYLKKADGEIYGPVGLNDLALWASDGRIAPDDEVSTDQKAWKPAASLAELGMEWMAILPDDTEYGPLHLYAMIEMVQEGILAANCSIQHTESDERHVLSEALLSVLAEKNQALRHSVASLHSHLVEARESEQAARAAAETAMDAAEANRDLHTKLDELRNQCKALETERTAWETKFHELETSSKSTAGEAKDEKTALEKRATEAEASIAALKKDLEAARAAAAGTVTSKEDLQSLRGQVEALKAERHTLREKLAAAASAASESSGQSEYKELATANDELRKDLAKWKNMYEDERASAVKREDALQERIDELRRSEASAVTAQDDLKRRLRHTQQGYEMIVKAAESAEGEQSVVSLQLAALMDSHSELSQSYDTLFTQLQQKSETLDRLLDERKEIESRATKRVQEMEAVLVREQEEADKARKQLAEMQQSHFQLVKSYREMNDRFIRIRQEDSATAAPVEPPRGASAPPPGRAPEKSAPKKGKGPRIRLNR